MATIHREGGFTFPVFPNDHPPAHVHAWARGAYVVIELPSEDAAAKVVRVQGRMKGSDVVKVKSFKTMRISCGKDGTVFMVKKLTRKGIMAQIPAARAAGRAAPKEPWWPVHVEWLRDHDAVLIATRGGISFLVPRHRMKELKDALPEQLVGVDLAGEGIRWDELDVDLSVQGLLADALGPSFSTRASGAIGGRAKSKAKAAAARANGAKGGRPRKQKAS